MKLPPADAEKHPLRLRRGPVGGYDPAVRQLTPLLPLLTRFAVAAVPALLLLIGTAAHAQEATPPIVIPGLSPGRMRVNFGTPTPPPAPSPTPVAVATPAAVAAPTPPAMAMAATPTPIPTGEIIQRAQGSLVIVEGREGAGSGFLCEMDKQKFLVTNAHVLAGNSGVNFTLLDGSPVRVGAAGSAVGHDMIRLAVAPDLPVFSLLERVNENLLIGDDVIVLGNEKGAHVITPILGKVVGLGPNLVEVDAPFQPGNSGSPIIQVKTGKVVGIATYVRHERDEDAERNRPPVSRSFDPRFGRSLVQAQPPIIKLRHFGYRLDSVRAWQPVAWPEFMAEAAMMKKVDALTENIEALIKDINDHQGHLSTGMHYDPAIQRPVQDFFEAMGRRPSPEDALAARQHLLDSLRRVCQGDLTDVRSRLRYDYFQRDAVETQRSRDGLAKAFDEALKAQVNTSGR